ncbi:MAG: T9SS type A sorting domain-containing protein, partial [Ignavibacteria bacterium]
VVNGVEVVATQVVELTIKEKNTEAPLCAKIKGMVAYEGNVNETVNGVVTAWRQEVIKKENGNPTTTYRPVYKAEIKNGSYVLMLPAGTYKIRVEGSGMVGEWDDDVVELADAKDVVVECNTIKEIDFKVAMRAKPVMVVAEGRVFDAATNEPLKALVVFEAREKSASADSRYMRVVAETREDGTYRVELQSGVSYIGTARVLGKDNAANQYLVEFYNNTHDVLSATSIKLTETKGGFDFPMDKRESFNNGFGGTMKNAYTNAGVAGKVVAYRLAAYVSEKGDTLAKKLEATTVETDQDGNYSFTNMIPGDYVVFGGPAKRPAMPGWMVLGATAVPEWGKATRVSVGDVMVAVQYDILLDTVKTDKGKGRVRGHVYDKRGGIVKSGADKTQEASAVLGALIIARDEDGNIVDFALSEDEGSFDMTEVAMGNIIIVADRVGFEPTTQTVAIEATNADQVIAIGMMKNTTTGIDVPVDEVGASVNLWPNPTSASASVQFTAQPGSATIRVVSLSGVELAVQQYTLDGGMQTLTVNTSTLPAGMVMVHITNGSTSFALPLNIVR